MSKLVKLIVRGALGGALGGVCWIVLVGVTVPPRSSISNPYLFVAILYIIPYGLATGSVIGLAVWTLHLLIRSNIGVALRVLIGFILGTIAHRLLPGGTYSVSLQREVLFAVSFGLLVGVFTGLFIGNQIRTEVR